MPTQFPATFQLQDINGDNGLAFQGISQISDFGYNLQAVGDMNHDGCADIVIASDFPTNQAVLLYGSKGPFAPSIDLNAMQQLGQLALITLNTPNSFNALGTGDFNGDTYPDLLFGLPNPLFQNVTGKSWLLFGGPNFNISYILSEGVHGPWVEFAANPLENSGFSVSSAGDVNGDGIDDFMIGSPNIYADGTLAGKVYIVFGKRGPWPSYFNLQNFSAQDGVILQNGEPGDSAGFAVNSAGDLNGDDLADVVVGGPDFELAVVGVEGPGQGCVVFGQRNFPSVINLFDLASVSSSSGFVFFGLGINEGIGYAVSSAGDINDDGIPDLVIGTWQSLNNKPAQAYVLFGKTGMSGLINLDGLAPPNGFNIYAETLSAYLPLRFNPISDFNHDGIDDLIIGNCDDSSVAKAYVLFGNRNFSDIYLRNLNGQNGFALNGVNPSDQTGASVSAARDFNGDGLNDLMVGAPYAITSNSPLENNGVVYIIFGDTAPVLQTNFLNVAAGQSVRLSAQNLASYAVKYANNTLSFVAVNLAHGYFSLLTSPTFALTSFSQADVQAANVQFTHDGTNFPPYYEIEAHSPGIAFTSAAPAKINFTTAPILINSTLTISQGQRVTLTLNNLAATNNGTVSGNIIFIVSGVIHGSFLNHLNSIPLTTFRQSEVMTQQIQFIHDNSLNPPSYFVDVGIGPYRSVRGPRLANINFNLLKEQVVVPTSNAIRNSVISASVSGLLALGLFGLRHHFHRKAASDFQQSVDGTSKTEEHKNLKYYRSIIKPIANKLFHQIKTTIFLGYRSPEDTDAYIKVLADIVHKLSLREININIDQIAAPERAYLINTIITEIKKCVTPRNFLSYFFTQEITPQQLRDNIQRIVDGVVENYKEEYHASASLAGDFVRKETVNRLSKPAGYKQQIELDNDPSSVTLG